MVGVRAQEVGAGIVVRRRVNRNRNRNRNRLRRDSCGVPDPDPDPDRRPRRIEEYRGSNLLVPLESKDDSEELEFGYREKSRSTHSGRALSARPGITFYVEESKAREAGREESKARGSRT